MKQSLLHKELSDGKCQFIVDNKKPHYVNRTIKMTSMYDKYCKQKDVTNYVLSEQGIDFLIIVLPFKFFLLMPRIDEMPSIGRKCLNRYMTLVTVWFYVYGCTSSSSFS